jgi:hypothetical protein
MHVFRTYHRYEAPELSDICSTYHCCQASTAVSYTLHFHRQWAEYLLYVWPDVSPSPVTPKAHLAGPPCFIGKSLVPCQVQAFHNNTKGVSRFSWMLNVPNTEHLAQCTTSREPTQACFKMFQCYTWPGTKQKQVKYQSFKNFVLCSQTQWRLFSDTVSTAVIIYC